jgi:hypothetical protein
MFDEACRRVWQIYIYAATYVTFLSAKMSPVWMNGKLR